MAENSAISWTHHTANFWHGCTKVSDGCKYCYAETLTKGRMQLNVWGPTADRHLGKGVWKEEKAGERHRVFCSSLSDFFEGPETCQNEESYRLISDAREQAFFFMETCPNLDFLLLTKRPENILRFTPDGSFGCMDWQGADCWPQNVWVGTSVENQDAADKRIPALLAVPAPVRFLSCEPLLGPVELCNLSGWQTGDAARWLGRQILGPSGINWVIVGGESGKDARPMHPDWARSLRDQCTAAGVPFHFKQWGEYVTATTFYLDLHRMSEELVKLPHAQYEGGGTAYRVGKHAAGRLLDGREWNEFPTPQTGGKP